MTLHCEDVYQDRDDFMEALLLDSLIEAFCRDHDMDYATLTENEYEGLARELTI